MPKDSYTRYPRPILWLVEGGRISIGGPEDDAQPRFEVEVEPFYISKLPVTNEQLEACGSHFQRSSVSPGDRDPASGVTYDLAREYCAWYAKVSRKPMRLPTEIEWEYACRAGAEGFDQNVASIDAYAWHAGNQHAGNRGEGGCGERVPKLDAKKPNDFGLYGMLGGLWEWTSSEYLPYPLNPGDGWGGVEAGSGNVRDAVATKRVVRGGSYRLAGDVMSCSLRRAEEPTADDPDIGFRIVKSFR